MTMQHLTKRRATQSEARNRLVLRHSPSTGKPTPDEVWHYTNSAGLLGIIQNHEFWAGSTEHMNDEQEIQYGVDLVYCEFRDALEPADVEKRALFDGLDRKSQQSKAREFILCGSKDGDSLTLWRNYGNDDVSYAICLDGSEPLVPIVSRTPVAPREDNTQRSDFGVDPTRWTEVIYERDEQARLLSELVQPILDRKAASWFKSIDFVSVYQLLAFIKHPGFRDEQELRLYFGILRPEEMFVRYRATRFGVTPYIALGSPIKTETWLDRSIPGHDGKNPRLPIKRICIGPTRYPDLAARSLKFLLDEQGYDHVEIVNSEVPYR